MLDAGGRCVFAISLVYRETNRSRQQPYAPFVLFARLWVVLVEMSFSVRVHPAPFSPTPSRHAEIELEMKGGGPGGSRLGQRSLAFSIPGWRSARGAGLQKEVCSLTHPPLQAQAVVVALRLALGGVADPTTKWRASPPPPSPGEITRELGCISFELLCPVPSSLVPVLSSVSVH